MSQDDSTAPESAPSSAGSTQRSSKVPLYAGLALLLVIGLVAFFALTGGGDDSAAADCVSEKVAVTAAPVMESLVVEAVKDVNGRCGTPGSHGSRRNPGSIGSHESPESRGNLAPRAKDASPASRGNCRKRRAPSWSRPAITIGADRWTLRPRTATTRSARRHPRARNTRRGPHRTCSPNLDSVK